MKRSIVDIRERFAEATSKGTDIEQWRASVETNKLNSIRIEPDFKVIDCEGIRFKFPLVPGGRDCNGDYNVEVTVEPKLKKKFIYKIDGSLTPEEAEEVAYMCLEGWGDRIESDMTIDQLFSKYIMNSDMITIAESNLMFCGRDMRVIVDGKDTDGYEYKYDEDVAYFAIDWGDGE